MPPTDLTFNLMNHRLRSINKNLALNKIRFIVEDKINILYCNAKNIVRNIKEICFTAKSAMQLQIY